MTPIEKEIIETIGNLYTAVNDLQHGLHTCNALFAETTDDSREAAQQKLEGFLFQSEQSLKTVRSRLVALGVQL